MFEVKDEAHCINTGVPVTVVEIIDNKTVWGDCKYGKKMFNRDDLELDVNYHILSNCAAIVSTSPHGYKFSDGTECPGNKNLADKLTLKREFKKVREVCGMPINKTTFTLSEDQLYLLKRLNYRFDIVIVPFTIISALKEMGVRDNYPNVLSFNSTPETMRSAPQDKIIDINNWSY